MPFIREDDQPAIHMNREIMDEFRELMRPYYYDADRFDTYLDQLGIQYPTLRADDGQCRSGAVS